MGKRPYRFWYFVMLAVLVLYGVAGTYMKTPYFIWVISNWLGCASQAYITFMMIIMNRKFLPEAIRPRGLSLVVNLIWATILLIYFFAWTIIDLPF